MAILLGLAFAVGLIGRCVRGEAPPSERANGHASIPTPQSREIRQNDYAERWPFVRLSASIVCVRKGSGDFPVVVLGEHRYALTGSTSTLLKIPLVPDAEWLDRAAAGFGKVDMDSVRNDAFRFCGTPPPFDPAKH